MASKSGGNKKRSSPIQQGHYKNYRLWGTREKNKRRKIRRHIKHYPNDLQAVAALAKV